jgi:hypothetical protein
VRLTSSRSRNESYVRFLRGSSPAKLEPESEGTDNEAWNANSKSGGHRNDV